MIGQIIKGWAIWISLRIIKVCVDVAELGILTIMSVRGAGLVKNVAVEHGSLIITEKFAVIVCELTDAVRVLA